MRHSIRVLSIGFALCAAAVAPTLPALAQSESGVTVTLELNQEFYYAGDPFFVRISVGNSGDKKVTNPVKSPLLRSFTVKNQSGEPLPAGSEGGSQEPARPEKLAPSSFYGAVVDLAEMYPGIKKVGEYEVSWSADGLSSQTLVVKMLPKYDPAKQYGATIDSSAGQIVIDFLPRVSPIAVKAFIDMANAGFYDGLLFHEVQRDRYIAGGDPRYGQTPRTPFLYPAEQSSLPLVAGTVVMKPVRPTPPSNGSEFIILLRPEPTWTGQVTIIGQVVEGLEVAKKISRKPSTLQSSRPHFKPLEDVRIVKVAVREKTEEAAATE